ncbi:hypothetical protein L1049_015497 [Liquidambar formosana]|uniref:Mei2-like C-terminal RNA recognition motif domain-containing protein n=1 Tax=Liquidambar formosana TaxID=63359 RepID=A0AAP0S4V1_LIQFO
MATLVAQKPLNPEALEFIPEENTIVTPGAAVSNLYLRSSPQFSPPIDTSFYYYCYPSPSLPPYFDTYTTTPLYSQPLYPNQQPPSLLPPPHLPFSPSQAVFSVNETTPCFSTASAHDSHEVEHKVVAEEVNNLRGVRRGLRNRWYCRRNGGRGEGFWGNEKRSKQQVLRKEYCTKVENNDAGAGQTKKPVAEVVPVQCNGKETTVMIRNIPNKYTRQMLVHFLEEHCLKENQRVVSEKCEEAEEHILSAFDFLYLPMDFDSGMNKSFAFVNFTDPRAVWKFHLASNNQKWEHFYSHKIREIACARIQPTKGWVQEGVGETKLCG